MTRAYQSVKEEGMAVNKTVRINGVQQLSLKVVTVVLMCYHIDMFIARLAKCHF